MKCASRRRIILMPKADVVVRASCACLSQLAQLCFRLLRPVGHAHFSVHRHRGGEVFLGLLAIAPGAVKFAETEVAVSNMRTHAAGLSEGQRLAIVVFGILDTTRCGDARRQGEGAGLNSSSTELARER